MVQVQTDIAVLVGTLLAVILCGILASFYYAGWKNRSMRAHSVFFLLLGLALSLHFVMLSSANFKDASNWGWLARTRILLVDIALTQLALSIRRAIKLGDEPDLPGKLPSDITDRP